MGKHNREFTASDALLKSGISAKQISIWTGRHYTTAGDYLKGISTPGWDELSAIFAKADVEQAQSIAQALVGKRFVVVRAEPPTKTEMDLDRDGDVDTNDLNLALIGVASEAPTGMAVLAGAPLLTSDRKGKCEGVWSRIGQFVRIGQGQIESQTRTA